MKLILVLLFAGCALAQTPFTTPVVRGTTVPMSCVITGQIFIDTDATAGQNAYLCNGSTYDQYTGTGGGSGTVSSGADGCLPYYSGAGTTVDDINQTNCRIKYNTTDHTLEFYDSTNTMVASIDTDTGVIQTFGTASEQVLTDISTPSAPAAGKTAFYTKAGQLASIANGGSEKLYVRQGDLNNKFYTHDTGGDDTYAVATPTNGGSCPAALADGLTVEFVADTTNTGAATLDFCGFGALEITAALAGTDLSNGDLVVGKPYLLRYYAASPALWIVTLPGTGGGGTIVDDINIPLAAANVPTGATNFGGENLFIVNLTSDVTTGSSTGTTGKFPYLLFPHTDTPTLVWRTILPSTWTGAVDVTMGWVEDLSGSTNNVKWSVESACGGLPSTTAVYYDAGFSDMTWNTASTVQTASNTRLTKSKVTSVDTTGCTADNQMWLRVSRDNTTVTSNLTNAVGLTYLVVTLRRSVQ